MTEAIKTINNAAKNDRMMEINIFFLVPFKRAGKNPNANIHFD